VYKQYLNDYEKRAEQIRRAARAVEGGSSTVSSPLPTIKDKPKDTVEIKGKTSVFGRFAQDDILLAGLLILLLTGEERDMTMIIILGYLLITGM